MSKTKKGSPDTGPRTPVPAVETGTMRTGVPPPVSPATAVVVEDEAAMWKKKFQAERAKVLELEAAGVPALLARATKAEAQVAKAFDLARRVSGFLGVETEDETFEEVFAIIEKEIAD